MFELFLFAVLALIAYKAFKIIRSAETTRRVQKRPPGGSRRIGPPTLRLTYQDFEGTQTTRDITPYKKATGERFRAFCHLRGEPREFVFSRVQSGVDLATGELLDRAGVFRHIHPERQAPGDLQ